MNLKQVLQTKKSGAVLPLALVVMAVLLVIGLTLLTTALNGRVYAMRVASDISARSAADAGLTRALFEMNQKLLAKTLDIGLLPRGRDISLSECDAIYSYAVFGNLAGGYNIISLGESANASRAVQATIGLEGLFDHAILTKNDLILKSGTVVDGYNSNDKTDTDNEVKIGTQSTDDSSIVLNNGVVVDGDVAVGVFGNIDTVIKDLGATINGNKHVTTEIVPLPEITIPALPDIGTSLQVKSDTISITSADNGVYSDIDLQKGILEVTEGDVVLHITGNIELGNGCEIIVKEDATLTIYVDGNIICDNGSGINTEAPPEEAATLQLYATGNEEQFLDVKAKGEWTGTIYAPDADVVLYADGDAYGSVIADSFEFKAGGNFHYDEALREVTEDDEGVQFGVTRWSESKITSVSSLSSLLEDGEQLLGN